MPDLMPLSRRSFMLMSLAAVAACKPGQAVLELSGNTMGTTYNVVAIDNTSKVTKAQAQAAIDTALAQVNTSMSNWMADSEISRFNAQSGTAPVSVSAELSEVMQAAEAVHVASQGAFDTTMGPLIELWGFGAPGTQTLPSAEMIAAAQTRSGHANTLGVAGNSLQKRQGDAQVYLAAIGKGYGADHVGRALAALGLKDFMVEIGGDLYASGRNADGLPWQIGIETPNAHDRGIMEVVSVSGAGMASSGDYRNYFEQDGQRYSHVIDPTTGRPITHATASATVLAPNAMLADAWATAMLTLGRERGLEIAKTHDIAVMFVERDPNSTELRFKSEASPLFSEMTA